MANNKQLATIGSTTEIDFLDYSLFDVPAKVDTGADRSSVWASDINVDSSGNLKFVFLDEGHPLYTGKEFVIKDFKDSIVKTSTGHREHRYRVKLKIKINEKTVKTYFTLSDRSRSTYPVLVGRKTLAENFIVDVSKNEPEYSYVKSMSRQLTKEREETPPEDKLRVGILSRGPDNYSTKRLAYALRIAGHEAVVVNHAECYVDIEQDNPDVRYRGEDISGLDAIIPRIGPSITRYGSAIVRQFEMMGVFTTARSIAIERSRNKLRSLQLFSKAGVGIPKTIFSRETHEVDDLIEQIGTPMIIKVAQGTHGRGVVLAENKKAAKSVIQAFYVEKVSILLQEFIEEASGEDIRAFVVGGRVVAAMQRKSLSDDFRSNIHMGGQTSKVKLTADERRTAIKAAKSMGMDICGVDMVRSKRGPLVLEVNSSPGLQGIEQTTEVDIATEIVKYIEQNVTKKRRKDTVGA